MQGCVEPHQRQSQNTIKQWLTTDLRLKKLKLVDWLAGMLTKDLPADEIYIHACGVFLQLHITVDFHNSIWTTLDIPNLQSDLAVILFRYSSSLQGLL